MSALTEIKPQTPIPEEFSQIATLVGQVRREESGGWGFEERSRQARRKLNHLLMDFGEEVETGRLDYGSSHTFQRIVVPITPDGSTKIRIQPILSIERNIYSNEERLAAGLHGDKVVAVDPNGEFTLYELTRGGVKNFREENVSMSEMEILEKFLDALELKLASDAQPPQI